MNRKSPMTSSSLPPGQREYPSFDRFGLGLFANRLTKVVNELNLTIDGNVANAIVLNKAQLDILPRTEIEADFHCVTTWSVRNIKWSGFRFIDFYEHIVKPRCKPHAGHSFVVLKAQDGYQVSMQLEDLLRDDVLLADCLNDKPIGLDHGAPLRLVAPKHYGYKNAKHLSAIEFRSNNKGYRFPFPYPNFMDHPRGRVEFEERATLLPLWIIRPLYRLLQPGARKKCLKALRKYNSAKKQIL